MTAHSSEGLCGLGDHDRYTSTQNPVTDRPGRAGVALLPPARGVGRRSGAADKLEGTYPLSIPVEGQALNITCLSYAGHLHFGHTGRRTSLPHLQRLLGHLEDSLAELER